MTSSYVLLSVAIQLVAISHLYSVYYLLNCDFLFFRHNRVPIFGKLKYKVLKSTYMLFMHNTNLKLLCHMRLLLWQARVPTVPTQLTSRQLSRFNHWTFLSCGPRPVIFDLMCMVYLYAINPGEFLNLSMCITHCSQSFYAHFLINRYELITKWK